MPFKAGNPYRFTPGPTGNFWMFLPGATSPIWDRLLTNVRDINRQGAHFKNTVITVTPASYNAKSIEKLMAFSRINTSLETRAALQEVGEYIVHDVNPRFFEEEGTSAGSWEQLKDTTLKWREKMGYADGPILQASGELYSEATSDAAIEEIHIGKNPRVILGGENFSGNNVEKYFVHMAGSWSELYKAPIPARPFMPQSDKDLTSGEQLHIKAIFQAHINHLLEAA